MILLKGASVTKRLNANLEKKIKELREKDIVPTLSVVRVGSEPDQVSYERGATNRANKVGAKVKSFTFGDDALEEDIISQIKKLNKDPNIHGIILLKPLPKGFDEDKTSNTVAAEKDIDGITNLSLAGVFTGEDIGYPPCTPSACIKVLEHYNIDVSGKNIAVIGRSLIVGKPVSMMLTDKDATVTICHTKTKNLKDICKKSDILVVSAGKRQLITREYMSEHHIILDVGIHMDSNNNLCGDVSFDDANDYVSAITPVPGGIGGVTTSVLMEHLVSATIKQIKQ